MNGFTLNGSRIERWLAELLTSKTENGEPPPPEPHVAARDVEREAMSRLYGERHQTVVVSRANGADSAPGDEQQG